jgi:phosphotransferase system enzyme I (PtsI)
MLRDKTLEMIENTRYNSEYAFDKIVKNILFQLGQIEDAYLKQKKEDIQDISRRVISNLLNGDNVETPKLIQADEDSIIIANIIHPSDMSLLNSKHIVGLATDAGGVTTHTSIIAKALELPAVVGLHIVSQVANNGEIVVVDGIEGEVIVNPEQLKKEKYLAKHEERVTFEQQYLKASSKESKTTDNISVQLMANIEFENEIKNVHKYKANGIGLYRSEFIFLSMTPKLPTEEQHFNFYKKLADEVEGEVVIRTLDLGGEKFFHQVLQQGSESNPVLGLRAVRFCMSRKDIFRTQLRAILKASAISENIKLMFPLISGVDEMKDVLNFFEQVKFELGKEGVPYNKNIETGIMIEVPSAAAVADILAEYVDFFSIGTNDLIQYSLAIDRANDEVSYLYQPLHPGVLRILKFVLQQERKNKIFVSMCGEMAGDPFYTLLLLGLGLRKFSMTPSAIPFIKTIITQTSIEACEKIAKEALQMHSASEISSYLWVQNLKLIPDFDKIYLKFKY